MPTECIPTQLAFEDFASRDVVGGFDGGAVTSNAGALLMREADRRIGLTAKVAAAIRDGRDQQAVIHAVPTLVAQRVHAIALGYEDLNDHDTLRHDPVLALLSDTDAPVRKGVATLAGKSTLQRLKQPAAAEGAAREHRFEIDDTAMERVFLDIFVAAHKTPPARIILDPDATDCPIHGDQEGRFFHGYYRNYCYLPLYIFAGRHLLVAKLRRANIDASAGTKEEIARIVAHLRAAWPGIEIWLRADSGFARDELMAWCEQNRVEYVFGMAKNPRLTALIDAELAQAKEQFDTTKKAARAFKELRYRTRDSWSAERRVVAKAEHLEKGANPRFIVTSLPKETFDGRALYEDVYCARGEMENRIKECQLDLFADRTSASLMRANQIRLWFASLAYVLTDAVRRIGLEGTEMANATAGSIRLRLLKLGAVVTRSVRRIKVAFATATPSRDIFVHALPRLRSVAA